MKKIFYLDPEDRKWSMEDLGLSWNDILKLAKKRKTVEGLYLAKDGKIVPWSDPPDYCVACLEPLAYNEEYDSIYCPTYNEWRDLACEDPSCELCSSRPETPSDCD